MGEMADDAYDHAMDEIFDDRFAGDWYERRPQYRRPPHGDVCCNRCGAEGLKWRVNDAGDWRLYEDVRVEGNRKKQHECNPASADDFEALD